MGFRDRSRNLPKQQEVQAAKDIGGKRQKASGALPHAKGDAINEVDLIDTKTTTKSFKLSAHELFKHSQTAARKGLNPVFQIELRSMPIGQQKWALIPWDEYLARSGLEEP